MAFLTVNSNTPLDVDNPLVSFKVRGEQVAAIMPNGVVKVAGVEFPDETYIQSATGSGNVDGGAF